MTPAAPTSGQSVQKPGQPGSIALPGKGQSSTTADSFLSRSDNGSHRVS